MRLDGVRSAIQHSAPATNATLLTPGPVQLSRRVIEAMAQANVGHRDSAFMATLAEVQAGLKQIGDAPEYDALLITGGGTAATEATLATLLPSGKKLLVVSNGAFGERLAEIAKALGIATTHIRDNWGEGIRLRDIEAAFAGDPSIYAVAIVHHETSTGILNPVNEIGAIAAWHRVRFIVDTVSSFGAEIFSAHLSRAAVVIGSANKCLHGAPGIGFVLVGAEIWKDIAHTPAKTVFLDLRRYKTWADRDCQTPFTPAVHCVAALNEAIHELIERGGPSVRRAHYLALNHRLRDGLAALGISIKNDSASSSASVIVAQLPGAVSFADFSANLRCRGFLIYQAKGCYRDDSFIVANMGELGETDIDEFLTAVGDILFEANRAAQCR
jgi:2-aminoethylphosphonate-pyruvate transaminase